MAWNEAVITAAGMELLAKCLTEGNMVLTRAVGGESCSAALSLMALKGIGEPCHELNLFRLENDGGKIVVNLRVQNKGLSEEYTLRQIGLFAGLEGDDGSEVLFAVIQDGTGEVIPKESDNPEFLTEFDFVIPVANTEKIQVEITPGIFATAEDIAEVKGDIAEHTSDKANPHGVTKAQVGLGNVPNVATNDQTPTYTAAVTLAELSGGEKLSIAFGKLAKAVKELILHIADNVKHITAAERTAWNSKAAGNHTHTAADIGALTDIRIGTVTTGNAGSNASASASTSGTVTTLNLTVPKGDKGDTGATGTAAGFGTPTATVDANVGTPSVTVTASGGNTAKVFNFAFKNLKGATGAKGDKGDKGDTGAAGAAGAKGATGTRGSRWTVGTAITGNSTTAAVFSGSGITDALVNDMYLNSSTGYVYKCTVAGAAAAAKWQYVGSIKGATGAQGTQGATGAQGAQGAAGAAAGFGTPTATVDANVGTPSVTVTASGGNTAKVFNFAFKNLKGAKGDKGDKGDTGATGASGTTWYTGEALTGTKSSILLNTEIISGAAVKDMYLNTSTCDLYRCTASSGDRINGSQTWVYICCLKGSNSIELM